MLTRRQLLHHSAALALAPRLLAQQLASTRIDVAAADRTHVLATAAQALQTPASANLLSGAIPALTAGVVLHRASPDPAAAIPFAAHAATHLRYLFVSPATALNNSLAATNDPEELLPLLPLAEIAQAIPFLESLPTFLPDSAPAPTTLLSPAEFTALRAWFAGLLTSFTTSRTGGLARDRKDHVGGTWLLVSSSMARLTSNDTVLADLRHRFKTSTLRAQILADGTLPHELTTRNPYRNSLFALDCLAGSCDLLSTRFESLWETELQDGPGLRAAIARHAPWIASRSTWPYPADQSHFTDLPCRRASLLLAARAYQRPEYSTIWRDTAPPEPTSPDLLAAFPIRQPILWTTRPTR